MVTAGPDTLEWRNEESVTSVKWTAIERLFLTRDAVCLLYGGVTLFLPKRLFAAPGALKAFVAEAMARLPEPSRAVSAADPLVAKVLSS